MKHLIKFLKKLESFFTEPIKLWEWIGVFSGAVILRLFLDNLIAKAGSSPIISTMNFHNWLFFLVTLLLVWLVLSLVTGKNPIFFSRFMALGSLVFVLPPLFDLWKTQGAVYWSAYLMGDFKTLVSQFITVFGNLPSGITYFGTKISFILGIILVSFWIYYLTRNILKTVLSGLGMYVVLFLMASFPSWLVFITKLLTGEKSILSTPGFEIAQKVGAPQPIFGLNGPKIMESLAYNLNLVYFPLLLLILAIFLFFYSKERFYAIVKNARVPQIIYHTGLFISGLLLGLWYYPQHISFNLASIWAFLTVIFSIWAGWTASVIFNDLEDESIDRLTNPQRPIPKGIFSREEYYSIGWVFFGLSILGGWLVGEKIAFLLLGYQIIAWWYSGKVLRLKKVPILATLVSALAVSLVFFSGFVLVSGEDNVKLLPAKVIYLLLLAFTFSIPAKDFKDIKGDKKAGIMTIPVIFGEDWGKIIVASGIFLSFVLSVFLVNELRLFYPAVFFGGLSFFTLYFSSPTGFIRYRVLPFWLLLWVFCYGLILVWFSFFC